MTTWAWSMYPPSCTQCMRGVLMDKPDNLRVPANNYLIVDFYSPHGLVWILCTPRGFWLMMNTTLTLIGMQDPKMKSNGWPQYYLALWYLKPHQLCFGRASPHGSRMEVHMVYVLNLGNPKLRGSLTFAVNGPHELLATSHDANTLLSFMQSPSTSQDIWPIMCAIGNASGFWEQYHPWGIACIIQQSSYL